MTGVAGGATAVALTGPGTCTACGVCITTCPAGALLPAATAPAVVAERCTGCLECLEVCPVDAFETVPGGGRTAGWG